MSDWRAGGSQDGLSQRSSLYTAPYKKINPSMSGGHIQEEISEMTRWANQYLNVGGHSDNLITDLTSDLSDGITLLRLVQSVSGEDLPRHFPNPMMKVQKLENLQVCIDYLKQQGLQLVVHPEELASGNVKGVLAVCQALRRHYTAGPSPQSGRGTRGQRSFSFLEKEDIAILSWLGEMVHRDVSDYTLLYDGKVLCELVNELKEDTIPTQYIQTSSKEERLKQAFSVSEKHFFIPHSKIDLSKLSTGTQDTHLRKYLQQIKTVYLQKSRRRAPPPPSSSRSSRPRSHSREELFESLRSSSVSHQNREEAKIAARTYEGLKQQKKDGSKRLDSTGSYSDLTNKGVDKSHGMTKHSSTEALQRPSLFVGGPLDRHQSMDTGIAPSLGASWPRKVSTPQQPSTLSRSISQTLPPQTAHRSSLTKSIESVNTPTFDLRGGLSRRTPSYARLESSSLDDLTVQVSTLEERVATLTTQFLFERQDMYKRMDKALVRERKKRQLVERKLGDLERMSKALMKHYDSRLIEMAKQVSVLRGEILIGRSPPSSVTMEIQQLKDKVNQLLEHQGHVTGRVTTGQINKTTPRKNTRQRAQTLFLRKKPQNEVHVLTRPSPSRSRSNTHHGNQAVPSNRTDRVYSRGSLTSFKKLSNFFGEEPPRLEDIQSFLDGLGYADLIQLFSSHDVTLAELAVMDDKDMDKLGVPLGPRVRILQELKKLQPVADTDVI